jgi:dTDP-4-amino-4,6-dideoxygalactose transaminase
MSNNIPFNRPSLHGRELELLAEALNSGQTAGGDVFSSRAGLMLADALDAADVILTTSCTDALELSALLLDLGPEDVVVVPSFTFVSTALAFRRTGATIRFADIDPETFGLSAATVEPLLDDRVRAVVPVHYGGTGVDLAPLVDLTINWNIDLVEDNAHGLFGTYRDRPLGSFGRFAALSFHETKNFICGEGGAIVLNRPEDVERAHTLCDKGTNRRAFNAGTVDHYTWTDTGSSFRLSGLLAAFLVAQLECREQILGLRQAAWESYDQLLSPHIEELGLQTMVIPSDRKSSWHMYPVLLPSRSVRDFVIDWLAADAIHATFHYIPLHSSPAGRRATDISADCPITDDVSGRLLRLPFFNSISVAQIQRVVDSLLSAVREARRRP